MLQLLATNIAVFEWLVRNRWASTFFGCVLGMWLVVPWVRGDATIGTLISFEGPNGSEPWGGLLQGDDGSLYGTTSFGGTHDLGTVFRISASGTLAILRSFMPDSDGAVLQAGLTLGRNLRC